MRFISTLCALALMTPVAGVSQMAPPEQAQIDAGSRVRISAPVFGDKKQVGTVVSVTRDTLVLRRGASLTAQPIATSNITAIEVSNGTHSRKAKGALWGMLIGAGAGAILGYALYEPPKCEINGFGCLALDIGPGSKGSNAVASGVLGGVFGALVGTLFGAKSVDTWVPATIRTQ
jgi:hypothetical protein